MEICFSHSRHEVTLVKDQCLLDIMKYLFSQRTISEWNKLSTVCVTAGSVNMFKNKVDASQEGRLHMLLVGGLTYACFTSDSLTGL